MNHLRSGALLFDFILIHEPKPDFNHEVPMVYVINKVHPIPKRPGK